MRESRPDQSLHFARSRVARLGLPDHQPRDSERYYGPTFRERDKHRASLTDKELAVVERFVRESLELQERQLERLRPDRSRKA